MSTIASYSYGVSALAFLLLSTLLATRWRARPHARLLAMATLVSAVSNALLAWEACDGDVRTVLTESFEILRNAAWSTFLIVLMGRFHRQDGVAPRFRPSLWLIGAFYVVLLGATCLGYFDLALSGVIGLMPSITARIGMAVLGMLLIEQVYRNKPDPERWAIKFACLGIGAMFAYDFYLYSDTMLFQMINPAIWAARGAVNALTVPLIAVSVVRSSVWSSELVLSRRVMFHSAALFGSAVYLLLMGSAGYYLRYFGGTWGAVMQVVFLFGALVLLASILFSGSFRAWLRVVISKHFYRYTYDYREEWLRFTRTLSEEGPGLGERSIEAVAALVNSPAGLIWIRREGNRFAPAASWHLAPHARSEAGDSPFCQFLTATEWVVDLQEYARDPDKYDGVAIPDWLLAYPRAWLVVPLMMHGKMFGFMLLLLPPSPIALNWEVTDLLKIAGSQAASYLAQDEASNALMVARQFESFNRMSTFVVHDLKNLVLQLSLLMSNAERHRNNPQFQQDMIETVNHSVQKMKLLLQKLSRSIAPERPAALAIERLLRQAVALKAAFEPQPLLRVTDAALTVQADGERLGRVVGHLIQNAIEATAKDGRVDIELARRGATVLIRISDTGTGMSADFIRERLFKPFESTKPAGMGIGVFESRAYIEELGGTLEVSSAIGRGTVFTVSLPLLEQPINNMNPQHDATEVTSE